MFDPSVPVHPLIAFWLDIADKVFKFAALCLGGAWTWWTYRKSRPYAQKLEIELGGSVFLRDGLCVEINMSLKNVGAARYDVQRGSSCILTAVRHEVPDSQLRIFPVFSKNKQIEPGETITDRIAWRLPPDFPGIVP